MTTKLNEHGDKDLGKCFDVIVVGAGPAGAMAAKEFARQGLKTILIEKEKIPRCVRAS